MEEREMAWKDRPFWFSCIDQELGNQEGDSANLLAPLHHHHHRHKTSHISLSCPVFSVLRFTVPWPRHVPQLFSFLFFNLKWNKKKKKNTPSCFNMNHSISRHFHKIKMKKKKDFQMIAFFLWKIKFWFSYLKVWTACREDDFVGLEVFPLRSKCAINQCTTFQQCVKILN